MLPFEQVVCQAVFPRYTLMVIILPENVGQGTLIIYLHQNLVEQDHRLIKRIIKPMLGFKSFLSACATISSIEIMHMIRKKQVGMLSSPEETGQSHDPTRGDGVHQ
jgi:hypothetical protein